MMVNTSLPPLIEQMRQPEFYPHGVQTVELMQTHASYVLLTGEFAYKLKKPVNYGFLNYSTLEQRHHYCQEELRLNQRGAAPLYLQVLPITQKGATYQLDGEGTVVEYVLKMRQFPQSALLSAMFERGELTEDWLRSLAEVIARYHQQAETSDYITSFGTVARIQAAFEENYEQTAQFIGGPQTQRQFDETKAYTDDFFETRQDLFQQRQAQGWIRACHGDLHLNNICYWQDQILLFDCIEFNEQFRFVDVMFDIAYIVMDLTVADRNDLAAVFVSHYVEYTGDWEGLQILPLYVSRQAYVRAKVTSFLLLDESVAATAKQQANDKAARYYTLAWRWGQFHSGRLLMMAGLSGSGKTTVARWLSRQLGAIHIRSDAVRKHLGGIPVETPGNDDLYTPAMSQRTYNRLQELGILLATQGYLVILDAKYDRQALRQAAIAAAESQSLSLDIIYCQAPYAVLQDRVRQRQGDIADATVQVLAQQTLEPFSDVEQGYVTTVDTTQPLTSQLVGIVGNSS